jgi:4-hydroxybenzoate polyprenyltransferase
MTGIKNFFKLARQEFIYGSHMLSWGGVSIVVAAALVLSLPIRWEFLIVTYSLIYTVYLYDRYADAQNDSSISTNQSRHFHKYYLKWTPLIIILNVLLISFVFILYRIRFDAFMLVFFMLVSGLFYGSFLKRFTKRIPGFKNFFVPLIWSLLIILMFLSYSFDLNAGAWLFALFVYLRIFIGVSFSDIKDTERDSSEKIRTLVVVLGQKKFLRILMLINILPVIILIAGVWSNMLPPISLILIVTSFYSYFYLWITSQKDVDVVSLTSNLVYAENIWWAPLVLLIQGIL